MLATIISTSGSTPASAFSKMLITGNGAIAVGTVGGGCLEGDVLQAAKRLFNSRKAEILGFHLNEDEFVQGLICGGTLDILIEPLTKDDIPLFRELNHVREEGEDCVVATLIRGDQTVGFKHLIRMDEENWDTGKRSFPSMDSAFLAALPEELSKVDHRKETRRIKTSEGELILEPVAGNPALLIFGGGHVSKQICAMAAAAGFRVTVVDDREEYANPSRFPAAVRTIAGDFLEELRRQAIRPSTYIIIVTRGHRYDEEILEQVIRTPAKYIGMIGSKRKVMTTYKRMIDRGVDTESLARVHAPMGLEIGAAGPEEIGVSIVAELIAVRRGKAGPYLPKSEGMGDLLSRREAGESMKNKGSPENRS